MTSRTIIVIAVVAVMMMMGHASAAAPTVSTNDITTADGSYKAGQNIDITITYSEVVTVNTTGGTPILELNTAPTRNASYNTGSGSANLVFRYTVQAGDTTPDLGAVVPGAISLNGGTIRNGTGVDASNTLLDDLTAGSAVVIDTTAPTISAVTIPNVAMKVGDVVTATITVGDDGGDTYTMTSGTIGGFALGSLSRTNATTYTAIFTIANGGTDVAAGANISVADLIIADSATNPSATYAANIVQDSDAIDANLPTFSAATATTTTITITFSENVNSTSDAKTQWTVADSTVDSVTALDGTGSTLTITLAAAIATDATHAVTYTAGDIVDGSSNALATATVTPTDGIAPTFTETIKAKDNTTNKILITFSEGVSGTSSGSTALGIADFAVTGTDPLTIAGVAHDNGSKYATLTMNATINLTGDGELFIAAASTAIYDDYGTNACDQGPTDVNSSVIVNTAPTLTISTVPTSPSKTKTNLNYTFEFSGGVTGFTVENITLNFVGAGAGAVNGSSLVTIDANMYILALAGQDKVDLAALTTGQTVVASVNLTALADLVGNAGVGTTTNTWTYDTTPGRDRTGGGGSGGGTYPPSWHKTPTVTATKASATATDAPPGERVTPRLRPTKAKPAAAKDTAPAAVGTTAEKPGKSPGFTAVFVIAGLLAVAYAMMRRRG